MTSAKNVCSDMAPAGYQGHWRDWHRGHKCSLDPDRDVIEKLGDAEFERTVGISEEGVAHLHAPLHALTLHRPWPMVMSTRRTLSDRYAIKPVENREWPPPKWLLGRHFALHAGKQWDYDGAAFIRKLWLEMPRSSYDHPLGIVAVGRCAGYIHRDEDSPDRVLDLADGTRCGLHLANGISPDDVLPELDLRWFFGTFGWIVDKIVTFAHAVPCRGFQKLWAVPDDVTDIVRELWKEAR